MRFMTGDEALKILKDMLDHGPGCGCDENRLPFAGPEDFQKVTPGTALGHALLHAAGATNAVTEQDNDRAHASAISSTAWLDIYRELRDLDPEDEEDMALLRAAGLDPALRPNPDASEEPVAETDAPE